MKGPDREDLEELHLAPVEMTEDMENFRAASMRQHQGEKNTLKNGLHRPGSMDKLEKWYPRQAERAKKVSDAFRLERSPPLFEAKATIDLGNLRMEQVERGRLSPIQWQKAGLELVRLFDEARTGIAQMENHVQGLRGAAEKVGTKLKELDNISYLRASREFRRLAQVFDKYDNWAVLLSSIIREHEADIHAVQRSLDEFWYRLAEAYGYQARALYRRYKNTQQPTASGA
ncbi:hypothetical protein ACQY0O_004820 [Thecaphora frezii]